MQIGPVRLTAFPSTQGNAVTAAPDQSLRNVPGFHVDRKNGWLWALDMGFVAGESELADRVGQMQVEFGGTLLVDLAQEVQESLMAMLRTRARDNWPFATSRAANSVVMS